MQELVLDRDAYGGVTYLTPFATDSFTATLTSDDVGVLAVPTDARRCIFHVPGGIDLTVSDTNIDVVPDNPIFLRTQRFKVNAPGLELNQGITTLYFKVSGSAKIIVEFFR